MRSRCDTVGSRGRSGSRSSHKWGSTAPTSCHIAWSNSRWHPVGKTRWNWGYNIFAVNNFKLSHLEFLPDEWCHQVSSTRLLSMLPFCEKGCWSYHDPFTSKYSLVLIFFPPEKHAIHVKLFDLTLFLSNSLLQELSGPLSHSTTKLANFGTLHSNLDSTYKCVQTTVHC